MEITKPKRNANKVRSPLEPSDVDYGGHSLYVCATFDQGGTTGWSVFGIYMDALRSDDYKILDNIAFWSAGEFTGSENSQVDQMLALASNWQDAHLLLEDFHLRQLAGGSEMLSPVRLMAAFRYGLHLMDPNRNFIIQAGTLAMTTITDERQKEWGFWIPGQQHARDAVKHNLTWLRRAKEIMTVRTSAHPRGHV